VTETLRRQPLEDAVRGLVETLRAIDCPPRRIEVQVGDARIAVDFADPADRAVAAAGAGLGLEALVASGVVAVPLAAELTQGQKVPNVSEQTAVGALTKRIRRTDPEFAGLVSNQNPAIVFKDEEGTGADRMMTARLQAGLDALAVTVATEWPGVTLRVTEAWDESDEHAPNSLHYEARAADLTTSPRDGAKLGRLARLAVDAGLDWVFFEDSAHVHVAARRT
jgi:hypothetical protein